MSQHMRESFRIATIAINETTSNVIPLRGRVIGALRIPATIEGTAITFTASEKVDGTFAPLYDSNGAQVSVAVAASRYCALTAAEGDALGASAFIKLVSNAAGGENAAVDIIVVLK